MRLNKVKRALGPSVHTRAIILHAVETLKNDDQLSLTTLTIICNASYFYLSHTSVSVFNIQWFGLFDATYQNSVDIKRVEG